MKEQLIQDEYSFTTFNNAGLEVKCDTLGVIKSPELGSIIIYTDYTLNAENKFNLYVSKLISEEEGYRLEQLDNYENIPVIQDAMQKIMNNL